MTTLAEWDWVCGEADDWERLHRLVSGTGRDGFTVPADEVRWDGVTACGLAGAWHVPGVLARLGDPRCPACCAAAGYPEGAGSPKNDPACRPLVEARLAAGGTT